ncbi:P-loop containing nucleoside triphosphate hydrolase protein [Meredithblackwellia eburnea MCA 4105]
MSSTAGSTTEQGSLAQHASKDGERIAQGADLEKQQTAISSATEDPVAEPKLKFIPFVGRKQPRDPYPSLNEVPMLPMANANIFSLWTYWWIQPLLVLGAQRTLQPTDLWKLPPEMESGVLADELMANFDRRRKRVEAWNKSLDDGSFRPGALRKGWWKFKKVFGVGKGDGRQTVGLVGALNDTFGYRFWSGGIIKLFGDVSNVTSPLVTKALIKFATDSYYSHRGVPGYTNPHIGLGIGLAFVLWIMQIVTALSIHQFFVRSAGTGVLARGALIAAIYRRSLVLSGKARTVITNGKLVNHISTDVSRIDFCAGFFHMSWTAPIQLIIIIIILLVNLGPSSLAGIGFLIIMLPPQSYAMKKMFGLRRKAMVWTDKRVKLIQELLGGMRVIKFFAWEVPYLEKLGKIRDAEMSHVRGLLIIRAANTAIAMSLPMLATVIAFLIYSGTGHNQDPAIIFTSLTLFTLLRLPLMMLPMSLSTITDAYNALGRLIDVFTAEERSGTFEYDHSSDFAIKVNHADFHWEGTPPEHAPKSKKEQASIAAKIKAEKKNQKKEAKSAKKRLDATPAGTPALHNDKEVVALNTDEGKLVPPTTNIDGDPTTTPAEKETLQLRDITVEIPRGQLCAVVGAVGSGKSSLLQAMVGEMRRTKGEVTFGGSISYCSQQAWIQNCTLKDNVLFGRPYDEVRYKQVIKDACLEADLAMLPSGDLTEIGEKGITLSGGQKQRVNIARALYFDAEIVLLDDPLSAVDAHVGKHLFDHAICGALKNKTRVLVTHALHFLPSVDYILCVEHGKITQRGTYSELMADTEGAFARLVRDFGGGLQEKKEKEEEKEAEAIEGKTDEGPVKKKKSLMQEEERKSGAVSGAIYRKFLKAAKGHITVPLLLVSLVLMQGAQVLGSYWLIYWQEDKFHQAQGFYMGLYAMFGLLQAVFSFLMGLCGVFIGFNASKSLHRAAIRGVIAAPMSFFDTSPLGRIMNRFSKDIDTIDNTLNDAMRMFVSTAASVVGAVILIACVQHYFVIAVVFILYGYWMCANFYRASAREIKRLDNFLRSSLYAHFSESLTGLATIRAYGEDNKFLKQNEEFVDIENRAYFLTVVNQRWLGFRLDMFGGILTAIVAFLGVGARYSISPSQTGLILSYILTIQQAFSWMVRQGAEVENDMNSVERVIHYADELEREAPAVIEDNRPPKDWPSQGSIELEKVVMSYRPGLPPVLKGLSLSVGAGEKVGVVGRTGAGKSSIMMALFRIVELSAGSIKIDGIDISKIGLADLRDKVAIIPQDALLFNGTIRSNLDPFGLYDDVVLWAALKRAWLVDQSFDASATKEKTDASSSSTPVNRFNLDLAIEDEGLNLSVGERSLVSLARALVKDARIIVLDEATASVDLATDSKIQSTIRTEFKTKTLLCIAHRLRTIINYDKVLVMDAGQIAEFDTPLNLFRAGGIFTTMCVRSGITEAEIADQVF